MRHQLQQIRQVSTGFLVRFLKLQRKSRRSSHLKPERKSYCKRHLCHWWKESLLGFPCRKLAQCNPLRIQSAGVLLICPKMLGRIRLKSLLRSELGCCRKFWRRQYCFAWHHGRGRTHRKRGRKGSSHNFLQRSWMNRRAHRRSHQSKQG